MELLDRYLDAVGHFLPRRQRQDILQEIADDIQSEVEELEERAGRALSEAEQVALLRRRGHPAVVAGGYRPSKPLIGPMLLPVYWFTIKLGLAAALALTVVFGAASAVIDGELRRHAMEAMLAYPWRALHVFAWTTLVFAALEAMQAKLSMLQDWDPRKLPKRQDGSVPRWRSMVDLLANVLAVFWLLLVPHFPVLLLGPLAAFLDAASGLRLIYVPLLLLTLANAAVSLAALIRPSPVGFRSAARVVLNCAAFLVFVVALRSGEFVTLHPGVAATTERGLERLASVVNASFGVGFAFACVANVVEAARECLRWKGRGAAVAGVAAGK